MSLDDKSRARGRARMKELAAEFKTEISVTVAIVLGTLGREPNELERLQAEALCSLFLRARKLRDNGKNDVEVLREAALMMTSIPWLRGPKIKVEQHPDYVA